jgi:cation diffusion facilitator CzcD-associated flavoprotein CzcO
MFFYWFSKRNPRRVRRAILAGVRAHLGPDYDVGTHFAPSYKPWDQRICLVPNGDLFTAIRDGRATVVTDHIETFTETGLKLRSGTELAADLIVTATGLELKVLGGVELEVDGQRIDLAKTMTYKGMMYSGVPNLASCVGYTNASWTLKCDLACEYVCRLLKHMDEGGFTQCRPRLNDARVEKEPLLDFSSGYVKRSANELPQQGSRVPWRLYQNYALDRLLLHHAKLEDGAMEFSR